MSLKHTLADASPISSTTWKSWFLNSLKLENIYKENTYQVIIQGQKSQGYVCLLFVCVDV